MVNLAAGIPSKGDGEYAVQSMIEKRDSMAWIGRVVEKFFEERPRQTRFERFAARMIDAQPIPLQAIDRRMISLEDLDCYVV